jgi:hypothetical protein
MSLVLGYIQMVCLTQQHFKTEGYLNMVFGQNKDIKISNKLNVVHMAIKG